MSTNPIADKTRKAAGITADFLENAGDFLRAGSARTSFLYPWSGVALGVGIAASVIGLPYVSAMAFSLLGVPMLWIGGGTLIASAGKGLRKLTQKSFTL